MSVLTVNPKLRSRRMMITMGSVLSLFSWVIGLDHAIMAQEPNIAAEKSVVSDRPDLLAMMVTEGVQLTPDKRFVLPRPDLVSIDGELVSSTEAEKAFAEIAGRHGDRFSKDSVVAPISVQTDSINNDAGERIGHFIDVAFVVHQTIEEIRKSEALEDFKRQDDPTRTIELSDDKDADDFEKNRTRALTEEELKTFGVSADDEFETLGYLQLPILSQVVVRGVARTRRSVWSEDDVDAPVILTWLIDSRFRSDTPTDDSIANQWRPIERSSTGEKYLGSPRSYAGLGGYVAITPVPGTPEASLVQIRFVLHEPQDWFSGRNLLRSKLPILVQDRVRNLRRELQ
ncbi:hypothetical protein [Neorhodopirellula pilleata]|uniref:Uncharacterized protein n=1 Tax=Neorhodopirellula pilleata TaxID=2714738 RepID=A0A5C6AI47_9BACT|nr:hypothetical protein [Neorhodopirellula pilleata]TWT98731.1 hypothetical protein Pla100_18960 [Neorhodopirellula pilleata]